MELTETNSILVIGDNPNTLRQLECALITSSCTVTTASSADEAVKRAIEENFDLWVLDHKLLGDDENGFREKLRSVNPRTRAVVYSDALLSLEEMAALNRDGDLNLVKPIEPTLLKSVIRRLV